MELYNTLYHLDTYPEVAVVVQVVVTEGDILLGGTKADIQVVDQQS